LGVVFRQPLSLEAVLNDLGPLTVAPWENTTINEETNKNEATFMFIGGRV